MCGAPRKTTNLGYILEAIMDNVHVAITRRVKPGKEAAFEAALLDFFAATMNMPGTHGAQLLRPAPGGDPCEYGILRAFESKAAQEAFYRSPEFTAWEERVAPLVDGGYHLRELHGLEAFFRGGLKAPPRWKMAAITWLGVFPAAYLWGTLLRPLLAPLPGIVSTAIISMFVVATLAWLVMPFLTRIFGTWLMKSPESN